MKKFSRMCFNCDDVKYYNEVFCGGIGGMTSPPKTGIKMKLHESNLRRKNNPQQESVSEFLARGGKITRV